MTEALAAAVCDLIKAAEPLLSPVWKKAKATLPMRVEWTADEHSFIRDAVRISAPERHLYGLWPALSELPQFAAALDELIADGLVADLLGKFVGGPLSAHNFDPERVLTDAVFAAFERVGDVRYDELAAREAWAEIEEALRSELIEYVLIAPLLGVRLSDGAVNIGPDISVERLSDEAMVRCLELGMFPEPHRLPPPLFRRAHNREHLPEAALCVGVTRTRHTYEAEIDEAGFPRPKHVMTTGPDARHWDVLVVPELVLTALRLCKTEFVSIPGAVQWSDNYLVRDELAWDTRDHRHIKYAEPTYMLGQEDEARVAELLAALKTEAVQNRPALLLALRRMNFAVDRTRSDDRLIDLLVAAEALLLRDVGDEQRTELRFRVALRAGRSFESSRYSQREVFRLMKSAYDVRSAIVHGGSPSEKSMKLPSAGPVALPEFVADVEAVMREGLRALVLKAAATPTGDLIEPDETLLGGKPEPGDVLADPS